jgi:asparagine synthetase B (glutamine-hydrolysing)
VAHRRLAIIDLSPAGHQPMATPDGRYVIAYNGEIYNFQELRVELEARGHAFRSRTDSEVALHAFAAWGVTPFPGSTACSRSRCGTRRSRPCGSRATATA